MGDHTETVEVEYDPQQISYGELLKVFWESHDATLEPYLRQYRNAVFYQGEDQREQALQSARELALRSGRPVRTAIEAAGRFYPAEDYHQKYLLRGAKLFFRAFRELYPDDRQLVASTAAARVNGYLGCNGSQEELLLNLSRLGLSAPLQEELVDYLALSCRQFEGISCPAPR